MKPTRVRHSIVSVALLINVVCYTDRACLAVAGPEIRQTFGLDQAQMGLYSASSASPTSLARPRGDYSRTATVRAALSASPLQAGRLSRP